MSLPSPIDLNTPNWVLRYSGSWTAQLIDPTEQRYAPIPEQVLGVSLTSSIIAITTATIDQTNFTKFGYIKQIKSLGINQNAVTGARKVWRGTQLVRFSDDYLGSYFLTFKPFYRLHHVSILVYELVTF